MAEPIKHDTTSALSTAGWEAVKGGLLGLAVLGLVGGLAGGLVIGGIASVIPVVAAAAKTIGIVAGIVSGIATLAVGAPVTGIAAGGGALIGLTKGGRRISAENQAYAARMERRTHTNQHQTEARINDAEINGMQQGYMMGFQEGQQSVVSQLQQMRMQAVEEQMASAHGSKSHVEKAGCAPAASKAEAITKQREAQAAAGQQIT